MSFKTGFGKDKPLTPKYCHCLEEGYNYIELALNTKTGTHTCKICNKPVG